MNKYCVVYSQRQATDPDTLEPQEYYALRSAVCGVGKVASRTPVSQLNIPGVFRRIEENCVVAITPSCANDIFVTDHAVFRPEYDKVTQDLSGTTASIYNIASAAFNAGESAEWKTFIPLAEYDGSYGQPVVHIQREIGFDEVDIISGPWPHQ